MKVLIISNARWLTPDGAFEQGNIRIEDGKIIELSSNANASKNDEVHEASGHLILPGAIDPHVHFREPGQSYKEGIANGSKAALAGGVTTIVDMPNNNPPCSTLKRVLYKKDLFKKKSNVNWGIMLHTSVKIDPEIAPYITSAKIYMARSSGLPAITDTETITKIMRTFPVVSFHAEDETAFQTGAERSPLHHISRPRESVTTALRKIEQVLKNLDSKERPRVIICHMNTAEEVEWIKRMRAQGFDTWGETCPHYLYFTQDDYINKGSAFQVNPAIRTKEDQKALRKGLADGSVQFVGTDHAPHSKAEKSGNKPPSGIAAIEWLLPQMLHLIDEGVIEWKRFHELMTSDASHCYNITKRDGIREGNFADLVMVKRIEGQSKNTDVKTRAGVNLYAEFDFKWRVCRTYVNGILKYDGQRFYEDGKGKEV